MENGVPVNSVKARNYKSNEQKINNNLQTSTFSSNNNEYINNKNFKSVIGNKLMNNYQKDKITELSYSSLDSVNSIMFKDDKIEDTNKQSNYYYQFKYRKDNNQNDTINNNNKANHVNNSNKIDYEELKSSLNKEFETILSNSKKQEDFKSFGLSNNIYNNPSVNTLKTNIDSYTASNGLFNKMSNKNKQELNNYAFNDKYDYNNNHDNNDYNVNRDTNLTCLYTTTENYKLTEEEMIIDNPEFNMLLRNKNRLSNNADAKTNNKNNYYDNKDVFSIADYDNDMNNRLYTFNNMNNTNTNLLNENESELSDCNKEDYLITRRSKNSRKAKNNYFNQTNKDCKDINIINYENCYKEGKATLPSTIELSSLRSIDDTSKKILSTNNPNTFINEKYCSNRNKEDIIYNSYISKLNKSPNNKKSSNNRNNNNTYDIQSLYSDNTICKASNENDIISIKSHTENKDINISFVSNNSKANHNEIHDLNKYTTPLDNSNKGISESYSNEIKEKVLSTNIEKTKLEESFIGKKLMFKSDQLSIYHNDNIEIDNAKSKVIEKAKINGCSGASKEKLKNNIVFSIIRENSITLKSFRLEIDHSFHSINSEKYSYHNTEKMNNTNKKYKNYKNDTFNEYSNDKIIQTQYDNKSRSLHKIISNNPENNESKNKEETLFNKLSEIQSKNKTNINKSNNPNNTNNINSLSPNKNKMNYNINKNNTNIEFIKLRSSLNKATKDKENLEHELTQIKSIYRKKEEEYSLKIQQLSKINSECIDKISKNNEVFSLFDKEILMKDKEVTELKKQNEDLIRKFKNIKKGLELIHSENTDFIFSNKKKIKYALDKESLIKRVIILRELYNTNMSKVINDVNADSQDSCSKYALNKNYCNINLSNISNECGIKERVDCYKQKFKSIYKKKVLKANINDNKGINKVNDSLNNLKVIDYDSNNNFTFSSSKNDDDVDSSCVNDNDNCETAEKNKNEESFNNELEELTTDIKYIITVLKEVNEQYVSTSSKINIQLTDCNIDEK